MRRGCLGLDGILRVTVCTIGGWEIPDSQLLKFRLVKTLRTLRRRRGRGRGRDRCRFRVRGKGRGKGRGRSENRIRIRIRSKNRIRGRIRIGIRYRNTIRNRSRDWIGGRNHTAKKCSRQTSLDLIWHTKTVIHTRYSTTPRNGNRHF